MRTIVDWHVHSKYSRACSKDLVLPTIASWCARKGIDVVATGDWTHPEWFKHLRENLVEDGQGVFGLKGRRGGVRFMLVTELSQIYKKGDKTRRVHNLVFSPSLETCEKVNMELTHRGFNLKADGRPILGIDSEDLYKRLKDIDERIILIPAHAWTPWYAIFGSKSGFDTIEECFGSMAPYIYAIETGLSSDPEMNWQLSRLDAVVCVSNSDAHSARKLGREANVFEFAQEPTYDEFVRILREKDAAKFKYTIEFFPQEGKYHFDGCASCAFSCKPKESKRLGGRCPSCARPLTLGVHHRVEELADRESQTVRERKIPYKSIVPLAEVLAQCYGVSSVSSKKVEQEYQRLTDELADEFTILLDTPIADIQAHSHAPRLARAISHVREGRLVIKPGYDGIYGTVQIFSPEDAAGMKQPTLL